MGTGEEEEMRAGWLLIVGVGILAGPLCARETDDCLREGRVPPRECLQSQLIDERVRMARALKALAGRIEPFRRPALETMQARWRAYLDAKCGFFVHRHAGTGGVLDALQCEVDETRRRTKELRELH